MCQPVGSGTARASATFGITLPHLGDVLLFNPQRFEQALTVSSPHLIPTCMARIDSPAETATEPEVNFKASGDFGDVEATAVRRSHPKAQDLDVGDNNVVYRRRW